MTFRKITVALFFITLFFPPILVIVLLASLGGNISDVANFGVIFWVLFPITTLLAFIGWLRDDRISAKILIANMVIFVSIVAIRVLSDCLDLPPGFPLDGFIP